MDCCATGLCLQAQAPERHYLPLSNDDYNMYLSHEMPSERWDQIRDHSLQFLADFRQNQTAVPFNQKQLKVLKKVHDREASWTQKILGCIVTAGPAGASGVAAFLSSMPWLACLVGGCLSGTGNGGGFCCAMRENRIIEGLQNKRQDLRTNIQRIYFDIAARLVDRYVKANKTNNRIFTARELTLAGVNEDQIAQSNLERQHLTELAAKIKASLPAIKSAMESAYLPEVNAVLSPLKDITEQILNPDQQNVLMDVLLRNEAKTETISEALAIEIRLRRALESRIEQLERLSAPNKDS
jgi:hypothetical protein